MPQVYAVIHNGAGNFMMAHKPVNGYFFSYGGGTIVPAGAPLNGGGNLAFPGGDLGGNAPATGARREFLEETNINLGMQLSNPPFFTGNGGLYYAAYFNMAANFDATVQTAINNIDAGTQAAQAVQAGTYGVGQYAAMRNAFPGCPADNELDAAHTWNLRNNIQQINALKANVGVTDWFFYILANLALRTYGVIVTDANGLLAGIATNVDEIAGPQYVVPNMREDPNVLLQPGDYTIRRTGGPDISNVTLLGYNNNIATFQ